MQEIEWNSETRKISDLKPNQKNPRRLSRVQAEEIKKSLQEFGLCQPIVVSSDGRIIGGHQRCKIWKQLGHKEIEVKFPNRELTEEEETKLNLRLNKNQGEFDFDMLANYCDIDLLLDVGFTLEDMHMEALPSMVGEEEDKPKFCTMSIKFTDAGHLQEAENTIGVIVDSYPGATYKVKIK